jgi:glycosyltransferase involved in cell wall biosynthesis
VRIAWWSPLPPQRSGISDYSAMLLPHLRERLDIVAVVGDPVASAVRAPEGVPMVAASAYLAGKAGPCDLDVYQMGNHSLFHAYMHPHVLDRPGMLVLHDLSLLDFYIGLCGGPDSPALLEEARYNDPSVDEVLPTTVIDGRCQLDHMRLQLSRRLVEASLVTVVHSAWAQAEVSHRHPAARVTRIHSPGPLLGVSLGPPRRPRDEVVFGVFGGLARHKRVPVVLEAFARLHRQVPGRVRLLIAGRSESLAVVDAVRQEITALSLEGVVDLVIDLSPEGFERAILGCDVVIGLRGPTVGETSATIMRSLGAGKPVIVSDLPQYREFDRTFCWPIPTDPSEEVAALVELMQDLVADPLRRSSGGTAARHFVASHATPAMVARRYAAVFEKVFENPSGSSRRRRVEVSIPAAQPVAEVNAFGDWTATTGLAEAARRSVTALAASGVCVWLNDRQVPGISRAEERMPARLRELRAGRHGPIDLWYLNVNEFLVVGDAELRPNGSARHVIGHWFWELPAVATTLVPQIARVDELWVGSRFTAAAFRGHTDKPIHVMPVPIETAPDPRLSRADFGLPDAACLFLFHFDATSTPARKNPWAVLRAFGRAFEPSERQDKARLVIKTLNLRRLPELHERLTREIAAVDGILIDENLSRSAMDALISVCDVYASLHRSEGFGMGMAEAMLLGLPVVATGYSGNMEFMTQANSCLTGYRLRPVDEVDLAHHPGLERIYELGQLWAEPDVDHAARWMRWLYENPAARRRIGAAGSATIRRRYSPEAAGAAMAARLAELAEGFAIDGRPGGRGGTDVTPAGA